MYYTIWQFYATLYFGFMGSCYLERMHGLENVHHFISYLSMHIYNRKPENVKCVLHLLHEKLFCYFSYRIIELFVYAQTASFPLITTSPKILVTFCHVKLLFLIVWKLFVSWTGIKVLILKVLYRMYNKYFVHLIFIFQSKISRMHLSLFDCCNLGIRK